MASPRNGNHAFINQLLVYTLVMICGSGSVGLATVWMRHEISLTANATRRLDALITETERRLDDVAIEVTGEQAPDVLERRNRDWRLGLVAPSATQVVWVAGSPEDRLSRQRNEGLYRDGLGLDLMRNSRNGLARH